jgi:uncharacterized membrane protein
MRLIRALCGPFFVFAGVMHFIKPRFYLQMMPEWLPAHEAMNYLSGAAEVVGGLALMSPDPKIRRAGGWFTLLILAAVYPANIHMALNADQFPDVPGGQAALIARLPFQAVFAAWVWTAMNRRSAKQTD